MTDEQKQKIADDYANKFDDTTWDEKSVWAAHYDGVMFGLNARDEEVSRKDEALNLALNGCSNHGCKFSQTTSGMKTNGRCHCRQTILGALEHTSKKEG